MSQIQSNSLKGDSEHRCESAWRLRNVQIFLLAWLFYQYLRHRLTFVIQIWAPQGASILVPSLRMNSRKRLAHSIRFCHTCCWLCTWCHIHKTQKQNGSAPSHGFIIIIYPLTARVIGAPQMISQPVFSVFPCSPLPSGTCPTPGLSIPWCCLPISFSVCLVFFPLHCALQDGFGQTWWIGDMTIPLQSAPFYDHQEVFVRSNCVLDLGTDFLVGNVIFVWGAWYLAVPPYFHCSYSSLKLCCEGPRFTGIQEDGCDRERISRILELREMLLSFQTGFSLISATVVCTILESISGLESSSDTTEPRYLKLVTVLSSCPFTLQFV